MPATPPMTPPAMAPVWSEEEDNDESWGGGGVLVVGGSVECFQYGVATYERVGREVYLD